MDKGLEPVRDGEIGEVQPQRVRNQTELNLTTWNHLVPLEDSAAWAEQF